MRFAFVADTPDWACHRQGMGLVKYGATEEDEWYATLDLYVADNDEETPTPVSQLEAASCGVSIVTTRCGILWSLLPSWAVVDRPGSVDDMVAALRFAVTFGRKGLRRQGLDPGAHYVPYGGPPEGLAAVVEEWKHRPVEAAALVRQGYAHCNDHLERHDLQGSLFRIMQDVVS